MMRSRKNKSKAFTMVEMLVTVSIFSLMIGVLVSGVFAGTRSWIKGDQLLRRSIAARTALDLLRTDIERARTLEGSEIPALAFDLEQPEGPIIQAQVIVSTSMAYETGSCRVVTWAVTGAPGQARWDRTSVPCGVTEDVAVTPEVETILGDVESVVLAFRYKDGWSDEVRQNEVPLQVSFRVELEGSPPIKTVSSVLIPAGVKVE